MSSELTLVDIIRDIREQEVLVAKFEKNAKKASRLNLTKKSRQNVREDFNKVSRVKRNLKERKNLVNQLLKSYRMKYDERLSLFYYSGISRILRDKHGMIIREESNE